MTQLFEVYALCRVGKIGPVSRLWTWVSPRHTVVVMARVICIATIVGKKVNKCNFKKQNYMIQSSKIYSIANSSYGTCYLHRSHSGKKVKKCNFKNNKTKQFDSEIYAIANS